MIYLNNTRSYLRMIFVMNECIKITHIVSEYFIIWWQLRGAIWWYFYRWCLFLPIVTFLPKIMRWIRHYLYCTVFQNPFLYQPSSISQGNFMPQSIQIDETSFDVITHMRKIKKYDKNKIGMIWFNKIKKKNSWYRQIYLINIQSSNNLC